VFADKPGSGRGARALLGDSVVEVLREFWTLQGIACLIAGPIFVIGYAWLLAELAGASATGGVRDLWLAAAWLAPEIYLVAGLVWVAHVANARREALSGFIAIVVLLLAQLAVLPFAIARAPSQAYGVSLYGLRGATLMWWSPLLVLVLIAAPIAVLAAWTPRVVPGKFGRVIGPQLGCLSVLFVAMLLPTWGGLAMIQLSLDLGFPTIWVDVVAVFVFVLFGVYWFWPED